MTKPRIALRSWLPATLALLVGCAHESGGYVATAEPPPEATPKPAPTDIAATPDAAPAEQPAAQETPPPPVDLGKLMADGVTFVCDMTDSAGKDTYTMKIDSLKKGMTWDWQRGADPASGEHGTVKTDEKALKSAGAVAFLAQGSVMPADKKTRSTPPFLLSRVAAKALRAGKSSKIGVYDVKADVLKPAGAETRTIAVDGTISSVSTIKATGDNVTLWFADDPKWPVLVEASFDGADSIKLTEVHTK